MMIEKFEIPVVTRLQDNGDGGFTLRAYNSTEEMLADHPIADEWSKEKGFYKRELTEEEKEIILSGDDEYEHGYIDSGTIKIVIVDGVPKLANTLYFHGGQ